MKLCIRVLGAVLSCAVMTLGVIDGHLLAQETKSPAASLQAPLNLNQASATDLQALPGIGPSMANRILEYRQKHGGFKKIEELMNVQGIGEKNFLKLRTLVSVSPVRTTER